MEKIKKSYYELLKDPRWQKKRLEVLERSGWKCERCGNDKKTLHVHHRVYCKGFLPWEYESTSLDVLCETCHLTTEQDKEEFNGIVHDLLLMGYDYTSLYNALMDLYRG